MSDPVPSRPGSEKEIFFAALDKGTPAERAAFLDGACGNNSALRARVEALLADHFQQDTSFMKEPAVDSSAPTVPMLPPGEAPAQMLGRYKLLEKIGEGGFGEVWMAEQREPVKRRVALKIIKLGMDSREIVARFEAERQALAMMDHANIAKIFDAGTTDAGRPYFVMELVRGIKITEYCDQNQLPTLDRLKLFILVCQAIQHAHQKGIIHRDIKPSNILVTLHDGVPVPKVIDFGIAKATAQELTDKTVFTQFQQFIGTPAYISPEQAEMSGLDIDTHSDIYSLGVLLYELLTGKTPFDGRDLLKAGLDEMRRIIREQEPVRPSTKLSQTLVAADVRRLQSNEPKAEEVRASSRRLLQELKGDLDWIVMKCLEKDRARRYETANGLAADLNRHLTNEPVVARPPSQLYRFQKAYRRNRIAFTAAVCVLVSLVIATVFMWVSAQREGLARVHESIQRNLAEQRSTEAQSAQKFAETEQQRADALAQKAFESEQQSRRLLYASDMNLAQQSFKQNNLGKARRLLDRHRPQPGEEDLRGWEWRYLWQLTRSSALVTLTNRPTTRGWSVSFSPDGTRLASGWLDGRVDLWDVPGRRLVRSLTDKEQSHQGKVAFSPVRNLLAATSEPKVVTLYDLDSGRESILWRAPVEGGWKVRDIAFSPDGSKVVVYARLPDADDEVSVVDVSSARIESRHKTVSSGSMHGFLGAARLSPDNRRLYLTRQHNLECLDLTSGQSLWQTLELEEGYGLTALALSPDGRALASCSGYEVSTIRISDAATGRLLALLKGHSSWICQVVFSKDGRQLISAATDQTIRFWNTRTWTEMKEKVLRGHTDEIHAVAISEPAHLVASAAKDGNLTLWRDEANRATNGYRLLPENLNTDQVLPLDYSRVLLLPPGKPPELLNLRRDSAPLSLPELGSSTDVLGRFGTNILCQWNGTNQIVVRELRGAEFIQRGAISLNSGTRPNGFSYNPKRQLLAWSEGASSNSVYLESLTAPGRRIELRSDVSGLLPFRFSQDGNYLAASTKAGESLRAWNVESGQIVASIGERVDDAAFAAGGRVLVVVLKKGSYHEIGFYDRDMHCSQVPTICCGRNPGRRLKNGSGRVPTPPPVPPVGRTAAPEICSSAG